MGDEDELERDLAEVVRLHPERDLGDEDAPVRTAERPDPYCAHRHGITLHEESHKVTCRGCDRELDPFKALLDLAHDWERHARFRKEAARRAHEAGDRLKDLLRLETNARARLKRIDPAAEKKAPAKPWGDGTVW